MADPTTFQTVTTNYLVHSNLSNITCVSETRLDLIAFSFAIVLEVAFNGIVFAGVAINRKKLRHNYVYAHVASVVMANIVLGCTLLYTMLNYLLVFERPVPNTGNNRYDQGDASQRSIMTWWALRKTFTIGMFLTCSGNVAALIRGISTSTYFVGRGGAITGTKSLTTGVLSRKCKVGLSITLTWLFPLLYCIPSLAGWNCLPYCTCLPAYYADFHCLSETKTTLCSNLWYPMTKGHLLVSSLTWFALLITIIVLLVMTIRKYYRIAQLHTSASNDRVCSLDTPEIEMCRTGQREEEAEELKTLGGKSRFPLHPSIKLLIALTTSYTLCTAPVMLYLTLDPISDVGNAETASLVSTLSSVLVVLYCLLCPAFLLTYMPKLRSATVGVLLRCDCTKRTVNKTRS